MFYNIT